MGNRIALLLVLPLTILLIGGCNAFDRSWAYVDQVCYRNGPDYYSLGLTKQTRELGGGRAGLLFFIECYSFTLAFKPEGRAVYSIAEVTLTNASSLTKNIPESVSGQIVVDMNKRMVYVSLKNRDGDFPGNGEYELR